MMPQTIVRSHKIALDPNNWQRTYFSKAAGTARFAYNWALAAWNEEYKAGGKPTQAALRRRLNAIKKQEYPWMLEVTKCAPQHAIMNLGDAFKNFFAGRAKYPRFKKKGHHDSFDLSNDQFKIDGKKIRIPNLGWVRLRENLRFNGKVLSATISRQASRWFVSISVEVPLETQVSENQAIVGLDLGIKTFASLSNGEHILAPKPHGGLLKRLRKLSRSLSRKQKGSRNRAKARSKLARLHARISHIREDAIHKATHYLGEHFGVIVIEDLNVAGMLCNRRLARSIADLGFGEFRQQLEHKAQQRHFKVVVADRWFASSKLCSSCGWKNIDLTLQDRRWTCTNCTADHDRDDNAAKNLSLYYEFESTVSSTGIDAWGKDSCGSWRELVLERALANQESNVKPGNRFE